MARREYPLHLLAMTTSRAAEGKAESDRALDRDTVELSHEDLSRLRALDEDDEADADRDTVELSTSEALRLAQSTVGAPVVSPSANAPAEPGRSGEVRRAPPSRLQDVEEPGTADRAALHTIPAPPAFEEE